MTPGLAQIVGVTRRVGIPSRRRRRRSGPGGRGPDRSAAGCSIWTPAPRSAPRQARRRDGIPTPRPVLRQVNTPCAINTGQPRSTAGTVTCLTDAPDDAVGAAFQADHAGSIPVARSARCSWWTGCSLSIVGHWAFVRRCLMPPRAPHRGHSRGAGRQGIRSHDYIQVIHPRPEAAGAGPRPPQHPGLREQPRLPPNRIRAARDRRLPTGSRHVRPARTW